MQEPNAIPESPSHPLSPSSPHQVTPSPPHPLTPSPSQPVAAKTRHGWHRFGLGLVALGLVLMGVKRIFFWGPDVIDPPTPPLSDVDPAVREALEDHLEKV